jgi:hypothetical protein
MEPAATAMEPATVATTSMTATVAVLRRGRAGREEQDCRGKDDCLELW